MSCRFGNSTLIPAVASSDGEPVCISPPLNDATLSAGGERAMSVSVYANNGQLWLASSDDQFIYVDRPSQWRDGRSFFSHKVCVTSP